MGLMARTCFGISKYLLARRDGWSRQEPAADGQTPEGSGLAGATVENFDRADYYQWRESELRGQFEAHFDPSLIPGKDILDFGCGSGALSFALARMGARKVDGTDLYEADLRHARERAEAVTRETGCPLDFRVASSTEVEYPDASYDLITCFDVLEHIFSYETVIPEWRRVLRPGGRILIWWQPHYHPYGHHLQVYIPIPWAHVLFSKKDLAETCERIFQLPQYRPRYWELDEDGNKLAKREFRVENLGGVNGLTIARFERLCREAGLRILRREAVGFQGPAPVRAVSGLLKGLPGLREFFTAYLIYEIGKDD